MKQIISFFLFIIFAIICIAILKTNPNILELVVNMLNILDKYVDLAFKGLLILCGILLIISVIIALIYFPKLRNATCNPTARAELLQKMVFNPIIIFQVFIFAVAIKVIFEIIIALLVHFI